VWFFDESRFGTHSNVGHAWYPTGTRTAIDIKLGYENFYLYSAVNPKTGEEFTLILPKVNTLCMNIFLEQFSKVYKDKKIVMVMDGATWHKSNGLLVTDNIRNIILPAYSPELNPVEKFWQYIKAKTIKNKVFDKLDLLENSIVDFLKTITFDNIKTICNVTYI
jgi:transposase